MDWAKLLLPIAARHCRSAELLLLHGSESPEFVDYALRNRAEGKTWLARRLDAYYLNQQQCRGLRAIHAAAGKFLRLFVERRQAYGLDTFALDLGLGCGAYAWSLLRETTHLSLVCLRRSPREVWFGRSVVPAEVAERCEFVIGDRLDPASYLTGREPDLAVCIVARRDDSFRKRFGQLGSLVYASLATGGAFLVVTNTPPEQRPPKTQSWCTASDLAAALSAVGFRNVDAARSDHAALLTGWKLPVATQR